MSSVVPSAPSTTRVSNQPPSLLVEGASKVTSTGRTGWKSTRREGIQSVVGTGVSKVGVATPETPVPTDEFPTTCGGPVEP